MPATSSLRPGALRWLRGGEHALWLSGDGGAVVSVFHTLNRSQGAQPAAANGRVLCRSTCGKHVHVVLKLERRLLFGSAASGSARGKSVNHPLVSVGCRLVSCRYAEKQVGYVACSVFLNEVRPHHRCLTPANRCLSAAPLASLDPVFAGHLQWHWIGCCHARCSNVLRFPPVPLLPWVAAEGRVPAPGDQLRAQ